MSEVKEGKYYKRKGEDFIIKVLKIESSNRVKIEVVSKNGELWTNKDEGEKIKYTNTFRLQSGFEEMPQLKGDLLYNDGKKEKSSLILPGDKEWIK